MGVLTDIVIADINDAEKIAQSISPLNVWKGIDAKGHNDITLGALFCILQGKEYYLENLAEFALLAQKTDEGPWVFEIPNKMINSLSQILDAQLTEISSKWLNSGELGDVEQQDIEKSILELRDVAQESIGQQKQLLMWISL